MSDKIDKIRQSNTVKPVGKSISTNYYQNHKSVYDIPTSFNTAKVGYMDLLSNKPKNLDLVKEESPLITSSNNLKSVIPGSKVILTNIQDIEPHNNTTVAFKAKFHDTLRSKSLLASVGESTIELADIAIEDDMIMCNIKMTKDIIIPKNTEFIDVSSSREYNRPSYDVYKVNSIPTHTYNHLYQYGRWRVNEK